MEFQTMLAMVKQCLIQLFILIFSQIKGRSNFGLTGESDPLFAEIGAVNS